MSAFTFPVRSRLASLLVLAVGIPCSGAEIEEEAEPSMAPLVVHGTLPEPAPPSAGMSTVAEFPGEVLRDWNIVTARQAMERVPGVFVSQGDSARASSFSVRGSQEITYHEFTGGRTGVGFYVDDIPCADAYGRDLALFAVDDLRFYKGPYGSAFGVPHSMGVIGVTTRPPGAAREAGVSYVHGSHELNQATVNASGPVRDDLFFGLDGLFSHDEGWFEDRLTGRDYGKHETASGRARLRWLPTDFLEMIFTAGLSRHDDDPQVYVPFGRSGDFYEVYSSPDAFADGGQNYQAVSALWKADGWQVKSITARMESDSDDEDPVFLQNVFDPFMLPRSRDQDVTAWTQEIRAESSDPDAEWRWRTGVFFGWRDSELDHFILGLGPAEGSDWVRYRQDDYALYGEVTRDIGSHLELSGGLRLQTTHDHTESSFEPTPFAAEDLGGVPQQRDGRGDFHGILPMAAAGWKWSETQRSYVRFSTGLQPGGEEIATVGSVAYDEEKSWHYELGHDSRFCGDLVQLHAALFRTEYRDYQSFQFNPAGTTVFNADCARAWGVEGELTVRPCDELELFAGASWTRARYDEFESPVGDFSGNRIENIPVASVNLGCAYRAPWGGMARLAWRYIGDTWFDVGNTVKQDGYSLVDARIGYERGNFGAYLFASNLLDEEYYTHSYLFMGFPAATPGVPRIVGVELRATY